MISAALNVVLAIAQGNGQLRRPILPSFLLIIWRTIAVACNQSSSLESSAMQEHSDSAEHFHFDDTCDTARLGCLDGCASGSCFAGCPLRPFLGITDYFLEIAQ